MMMRHSDVNDNSEFDIPLRIAVDARLVGPIIGHGGETIRKIQKETKTLVIADQGSSRPVSEIDPQEGTRQEKAISIYGSPENASDCCVKILQMIEQLTRAHDDKGPDVKFAFELNLRTYSTLVGRIIGRQGGNLKEVYQKTGCKVTIFNTDYVVPAIVNATDRYTSIGQTNRFCLPHSLCNIERTVRVIGPNIEALSKAERLIMARMRNCWESDCHIAVQSANAPAPNELPKSFYAPPCERMMVGNQFGYYPPPLPQLMQHTVDPSMGAYSLCVPPPYYTPQQVDIGDASVRIYIPPELVGYLIGKKGASVSAMTAESGADIHFEQPHRRASGVYGDRPTPDEVGATIVGTDEQIHKAQNAFFKRVAEFNGLTVQEVRLTVEIQIPLRFVGLVIGRGGHMVHEIEHATSVQIRIPDAVGATAKAAKLDTETTLVTTGCRIFGGCDGVEQAKCRIRGVISDYLAYTSAMPGAFIAAPPPEIMRAYTSRRRAAKPRVFGDRAAMKGDDGESGRRS